MKRILLSAAGFDPSSGAGVLQDLKVFERFGFYGAALITAVTTQNTRSVKNVYVLSGRLLKEQYEVLADDLAFSGIKVGMAGSLENLRALRKILSGHKDIPRVVDPIFRSSAGAWLLEKEAVPHFLKEIREKATVLTPNLEEAGLLAGRKVRNISEMKDAAQAIFDLCRIPCLVKGGHLEKEAVNLLYDGRRIYLFGKTKITKDVHGTGCFLSACLLGYLALGESLAKACELATEFTHRAIHGAFRIGRGRYVFGDTILCP